MQSYAHCGWIEVIVGPMHSGKSGELRRRVRCAAQAGRSTVHFRALAHHSSSPAAGPEAGVISVRSAEDILSLLPDRAEVVAIEEVHFLDPGIAHVAANLTAEGIRVILAGLDTDFRGSTFGVVGDLMAQAEVVTKLQAICVQCGNVGTRTQRLVGGRPEDPGAPTVALDGEAEYEPRCRACHMVPLPL